MTEHERDKAVRLVDYISQITNIRFLQIKRFEDYENVIWLGKIPNEKGCFSQLMNTEDDKDQDIWLEVKNKKEPTVPMIPDSCLPYVDIRRLKDKDSIPVLNIPDSMEPVQEDFLEENSNENYVIPVERLEIDRDAIKYAWSEYIDNEWVPWSQEHESWQKVNEIYTQLFSIHQTQLKLGEEYELVLVFGLLSWTIPVNQTIHRHLIALNAQLDFDKKQGTFTVKPSFEGTKIRLETDMLDAQQKALLQMNDINAKLEQAEIDLWDSEKIPSLLQEIAHSLHQNGQYYDNQQDEGQPISENPTIQFSPALILRKRSTYGLNAILEKIKDMINSGIELTTQFMDLAEIPIELVIEPQDQDREDNETFSEVYFPKPSNEEQYKIVSLLNRTNGILVQGPPGTGKSHTIANLICHLLAAGKRILVTAKTPRALTVLNNLVPKEVQPLCIKLLGSGIEERKSLEDSVNGILGENTYQDSNKVNDEIEKINDDNLVLLNEQQELSKQLRDIREKETKEHAVSDNSYVGTASKIAQAVASHKSLYDWFRDKIHYKSEFSLDVSLIDFVLKTLRRLSSERFKEIAMDIFEDLPTPSEFDLDCTKEKDLREKKEELEGKSDSNIVRKLISGDIDKLSEFYSSVQEYTTNFKLIIAKELLWMQGFLRDIFTDKTSILHELYNKSNKAISQLDLLMPGCEGNAVSYPHDKPLAIILKDVQILINHLRHGGKLGSWWYRPRAVQQRKYLLKDLQIDGMKCHDLSSLTQIEKILKIHICLYQIWVYWKDICPNHPEPITLQYAQLTDLVKSLTCLVSISKTHKRIREFVSLYDIDNVIDYMKSEDIDKLSFSICLAICYSDLSAVENKFSELIKSLQSFIQTHMSHPIISEFIELIKDRDIEKYQTLFFKHQSLLTDKVDYEIAHEILNDLKDKVPLLSDDLRSTFLNDTWGSRILHLRQAWSWARTNSWLIDYIGNDDLPSINQRLMQIQNEIHNNKSKQAAVLAWKQMHSRLREEHRRDMVLFQRALDKLKRNSKYLSRYRREAQTHLDGCREAIPAWIMPLHRVWDTISPNVGMFDIIIIDEASQCGLEAIPLLLLGKKIIVVGDDKQISPEAVGVTMSNVYAIMDQYLSDFRYKDSLSITSSLFDQAKLRFSRSSVTLREHFRCMPEIISFSNNLCYTQSPLIPLRQYGTGRLNPLEHVYIENGLREGNNSKVINRLEAEQIANKIDSLCKEDKYEGKTMGVIVLQGEAQAGLIEKELLKKISVSEFENRRIICGNPYSFQGDERDIIFLSMVAATNARIGPFSSETDTRRFNVAASRARDQIWLFHSVDLGDLSTNDLRRKLLEHFINTNTNNIAGIEVSDLTRIANVDNRNVLPPPSPFDSWFEVDVALQIAQNGYEVIPQYEIAGRRIDLVVEGGIARLAIECDGDTWHGADRYEDDMIRQRQLERCGWNFWRVRGSEYYVDPKKALLGLWEKLDEHGIFTIEKRKLIDMGVVTQTNEQEIIEVLEQDILNDEDNNGYHDIHSESYLNGHRDVESVSKQDIIISIIKILDGLPNKSSTVDSMPTKVLKYLGVVTRGRPRENFCKMVDECINILNMKSRIAKYKAKNWRIKLV